MKKQYKYLLNESDIPKQWYNIVPEVIFADEPSGNLDSKSRFTLFNAVTDVPSSP